jgi:hypothetical protein
MRRLTRWALIRLVLPALDSLILWAFGWRREWIEGVGCGPHYADPKNPNTYLLRDAAVRVATERAMWKARTDAGGEG